MTGPTIDRQAVEERLVIARREAMKGTEASVRSHLWVVILDTKALLDRVDALEAQIRTTPAP